MTTSLLFITLILLAISISLIQIGATFAFSPTADGSYASLTLPITVPAGMDINSPTQGLQNVIYTPPPQAGMAAGYYAQIGTMALSSSDWFFNPKHQQLHCQGTFANPATPTISPRKLRIEVFFTTLATTSLTSYRMPLFGTERRYTTGYVYIYEPALQNAIDFLPPQSSLLIQCPKVLALSKLRDGVSSDPEVVFDMFPELRALTTSPIAPSVVRVELVAALSPPSPVMQVESQNSIVGQTTLTMRYIPNDVLNDELIFYLPHVSDPAVQELYAQETLPAGIDCFDGFGVIVGQVYPAYAPMKDKRLPTPMPSLKTLSMISASAECTFSLQIPPSVFSQVTTRYKAAIAMGPPTSAVEVGFYGINGYSKSDLEASTTLSSLSHSFGTVAPPTEPDNFQIDVNYSYTTGSAVFTVVLSKAPVDAISIQFSKLTFTLDAQCANNPSATLPSASGVTHWTFSFPSPQPREVICTFTSTTDFTQNLDWIRFLDSIGAQRPFAYLNAFNRPISPPNASPSTRFSFTQLDLTPYSLRTSPMYLDFSPCPTPYVQAGVCIKFMITSSSMTNSRPYSLAVSVPNTHDFVPIQKALVTQGNNNVYLTWARCPPNSSTTKCHVFHIGTSITDLTVDPTLLYVPVSHVPATPYSYISPFTLTTPISAKVLPYWLAESTYPLTSVSASSSTSGVTTSASLTFNSYKVRSPDPIWYRHPETSQTVSQGYDFNTFPHTLYRHLLNSWRSIVVRSIVNALTGTATDQDKLTTIENQLYLSILPSTDFSASPPASSPSIPQQNSPTDITSAYQGSNDPRIGSTDGGAFQPLAPRRKLEGTMPSFIIRVGTATALQTTYSTVSAGWEPSMRAIIFSVFNEKDQTIQTSLTEQVPSTCFTTKLSERFTKVFQVMCAPVIALSPPWQRDTSSNSLHPESPFLFDPIYSPQYTIAPEHGNGVVKLAPGALLSFDLNWSYITSHAMIGNVPIKKLIEAGFTVVFDYAGLEYGIPVGVFPLATPTSSGSHFPYTIRIPMTTLAPYNIRFIPNNKNVNELMQFSDMAFPSPLVTSNTNSLHGLVFEDNMTLSCDPGDAVCLCYLAQDPNATVIDESQFIPKDACPNLPNTTPSTQPVDYDYACFNTGPNPYGPQCANHINLYTIAISSLTAANTQYDPLTKLRLKHQLLALLQPGVPVNSNRLRIYNPSLTTTTLYKGLFSSPDLDYHRKATATSVDYVPTNSVIYIIGEVDLRESGYHTTARYYPKLSFDTGPKINHLDLIFHRRIDDFIAIPVPTFPSMCRLQNAIPERQILCIDPLAIVPPTTSPKQYPLLLSQALNVVNPLVSSQHTPLFSKSLPPEFSNQLPQITLNNPTSFTTLNDYTPNPILGPVKQTPFPTPYIYFSSTTPNLVFRLIAELSVLVNGSTVKFQLALGVPLSSSSPFLQTTHQNWFFGSLFQNYDETGQLLANTVTLPYLSSSTYTIAAVYGNQSDMMNMFNPANLIPATCTPDSTAIKISASPTALGTGLTGTCSDSPVSSSGKTIGQMNTISSRSQMVPTSPLFLAMKFKASPNFTPNGTFCQNSQCVINTETTRFMNGIMEHEIRQVLNSTAIGIPIQDVTVLDGVFTAVTPARLLTVRAVITPAGIVDPLTLKTWSDEFSHKFTFIPDIAGFATFLGLNSNSYFAPVAMSVFQFPQVNYRSITFTSTTIEGTVSPIRIIADPLEFGTTSVFSAFTSAKLYLTSSSRSDELDFSDLGTDIEHPFSFSPLNTGESDGVTFRFEVIFRARLTALSGWFPVIYQAPSRKFSDKAFPSSLTFDNVSRIIQVRWSPTDPLPQSYFKFKLYPYSTTAPGPSFNPVAILTSTVNLQHIAPPLLPQTIFPDVVYLPLGLFSADLSIPNHISLPNGFTVVVEDALSGVDLTLASSLTEIPALPTSMSPGPTCPFSCPLKMVQSTIDCSCSCTDANCKAFTRTAMMFLTAQQPLSTNISPAEYLKLLRIELAAQLQLSQLPASATERYYTYTHPPIITEVKYNGFPGGSQNVLGIESITVLPVNPASSVEFDLSAILITVTIDPFLPTTTAEMLNPRFQQLSQRLQAVTSFQTLEVASILGVSLESYNTRKFHTYPLPTNALNAQCSSATAIPKVYGACPPISQLTSPMWSKCPTPSIPTSRQYLLPICYDISGKTAFYSRDAVNSQLLPTSEFTPFATWCNNSIPNYPIAIMTSTSSCSKPTTLPPEPTITSFTASPSANIQPTTIVKFSWTYPPTANEDYTVNLYLSNPSMNYRRTLILNVPAKLGTISVQMPSDIQPNSQTKITIQVNQRAAVKTELTLNVIPLNKCPTDSTALRNYCADPNATCQPLTGLCACGFGYQFDPTELISSTFDSKTASCVPLCDKPCANGTECKINANWPTGAKCDCLVNSDLTGDYCERRVSCAGLEKETCSGHGYLTLNPVTNECSTGCTCDGNWHSSNCSLCSLTAVDGQCDPKGTDAAATVNAGCSQCVCHRGFSGVNCADKTVYGTVSFTTASPASAFSSSVSIISLSALSDDLLSDELSNFSRFHAGFTPTVVDLGLDLVSIEGQNALSLDLALSLGLPPSSISTARITQRISDPDTSTFSIAATSKSTNVTFAMTPTADSSNNGFNMNDLYNQWANLKQDDTFKTTPISQTEAEQEIGAPAAVQDDVYDPNCDSTNPENDCPTGFDPFADPSDPDAGTSSPSTSSVGVIVAVVIGSVAGVGLIFVITICVVGHGKKHQKWCWKPKKANNNDHLELTVNTATMTPTSIMNSSQSATSTPFSSGTSQSVDLVDVTEPSDQLPPGWFKMKHIHTQQVLYVNQTAMTSQKHHPNDTKEDDENGFGFN